MCQRNAVKAFRIAEVKRRQKTAKKGPSVATYSFSIFFLVVKSQQTGERGNRRKTKHLELKEAQKTKMNPPDL